MTHAAFIAIHDLNTNYPVKILIVQNLFIQYFEKKLYNIFFLIPAMNVNI